MQRIITHTCLFLLLGLLSLLTSCAPKPHDAKPADEPLVIYPAYQGVTLPCNIAPLNFLLRNDVDAVSVSIAGKTWNQKGCKMVFEAEEWKELVANHLGDSLKVQISARRKSDKQWLEYPAFSWHISADSLDRYLTYRLIEPGYEVWDNVAIEERCTETFETRMLADGRQLGNRCMNCHTHGGDRGQYSFFYIRGDKGGTLLNRDGRLRKVTLKNDRMGGGSVYGDWHPSGRYAVFSTNVIIPAFHSLGSRRLEVYDTTSDLCVADFDRDSMLVSPLVTKTPETLETFPAFSADGRWIFFCSAQNPCGDTIPSSRDLRDHVDELQYSLCRIAFDAETGTLGNRIDTIYNARTQGGSANFPKCSPDGRWLCFTRSSYGTFPIWHAEATLCLLPIEQITRPEVGELTLIDTHQNGTYHSWSRNGRWLCFASKRADGQYGRVHFMHIDDLALTSAALTLPQSDPEMDDWNLRSYNIPDLSATAAPYGQNEVKMLLEDVVAQPFR